jgi:HEAT repeat protein
VSRPAHPRRPEPLDAAVSIRELLSGGNPRTLTNVAAVVELVLTRPERVDELIDCLVDSGDEIVRMRAGDALEKACRARPVLLQPHVPLLLGAMAKIEQASVRWHVAQMLGLVRLTPRQRARAVRILCGNLDSSPDWIVLNCSLDTLAAMARLDPTLVEPLRGYLRRFEHDDRRSLSSRARKLLAEFGR